MRSVIVVDINRGLYDVRVDSSAEKAIACFLSIHTGIDSNTSLKYIKLNKLLIFLYAITLNSINNCNMPCENPSNYVSDIFALTYK